jgi:hypothetical protein
VSSASARNCGDTERQRRDKFPNTRRHLRNLVILKVLAVPFSSIGALIGSGELDGLDTQQPTPLRLIPETVLQRPLRILLAQVHVDRFGIAGLDKRVQAHRVNVIG